VSQQPQRYTVDEPYEEERPQLKSRRELREEAAHSKGKPFSPPRSHREGNGSMPPARPMQPVRPVSGQPSRTYGQKNPADEDALSRSAETRRPMQPVRPVSGQPSRTYGQKNPADEDTLSRSAETRRTQAADPAAVPPRNRPAEEEKVTFKGGSNRGGDRRDSGKGRPVPVGRSGLIIAIIVGCIVLFAAIVAALGLNVFVVKNVDISGGINYTPAEMMEAMGLRMGQSMFTVSGGAMENALKDKPTLILEKVERRFPDTVQITVRETTPTMVVAYLNQYALLDNELRVLSLQAALPEGDYPLVTGVVVLDAQQGEAIVSNDKGQITALTAIVAAFGRRSDIADESTYAPLHYVSEIKIQNVEEIYMYTTDGYTIELGNTENLERKALWVEQMLPVFKQKGYAGGVLDVTASSAATFIPAAGQAEQATQAAVPATVPQTVPEGEEETQPEDGIPVATPPPGAAETTTTPAEGA